MAKICALLLAAVTSYWSFDAGPSDVISDQGDVAATLGMSWADGSWTVTGDPDLTWGLLLTMHSGQPGDVALVTSDQRIIGVHSDPAASFKWGAVGNNAWLISPSPHDYRVVIEIPHSTLSLDSLTITNEIVTLGPDVNYDGVVNIFDVNLVSSHWGEVGPLGDANGDHAVNVFDQNAIAANWTSVAAVDEPPTLALVLAGLAALRFLHVSTSCARVHGMRRARHRSEV